MKATAKNRSEPFICDVPATMLKRSAKLSRGARLLYLTMRSLANGKTGELAIRGNPLDWRYISKQAEMCRNVWQRCLKELILAGHVTRDHEIVEHYKDGRKRMVWGRARYFAHRQPKTIEVPTILPMPLSCTVEGKGTQISSESPYCPDHNRSPMIGRKAVESTRTRSSSCSPRTPDDERALRSLKSKTNCFLQDEDQILLTRIRKRISERHEQLYRQFREQIQDDDFMMAGIELIGIRGEEQILNPLAYFTSSIVEIFLAAEPGERLDDDFGCPVEESRRRRELRDKYMGQLQPLSAESEEKRQQFNRMVESRCSD